MPTISDKRRLCEIIAVVLTAAGKFVFMDYLDWRLGFVVTAIVLWLGYIIYNNKTTPAITKHWGFRTDNFRTVLMKVLPFGLVAIIAFAAIGLYQGTINPTWHIVPILLLYPLWGIIQQYLLIALTVGNIQDIEGTRIYPAFNILLAAILFSAVHYPNYWLMMATFILAVFYGWIYMKERNLYVLGIFHGWLGGIFYYTVLDGDPYAQTIGKLFAR